MSSRVNIGKHVKDDHYRYTMEKLQLKIEGRGNGIKTILVNMANVARDLKVPPLYPTKYMGSELSTHASYDNKNDKYILNGKFDQGVLENSLNNFIQKFMLCKKCHYPEVVLSVDKAEQVVMTCMACGNVANVPPSEKLCKFIVTHPPPKQTDMKRVDKKTNAAASGAAEPVPTPVAADDDVWETDVSEEAIKQRLADEKLSSKIMEMTMSDDEKEDEEEDGDEESPVSVLKEYLKLKPDANDAALIKAIKKIKKDYELSSKDVICLLFEAFFETADIMNQIPKREPIFKHFLAEMKLSEVGQKVILGYVEELVAKKHKDLLPQVTKILTLLYKADLLDEPTALEWHKKKTSKYVKDAEALKKIKDQAKAFIEWLKTAADEEDQDENDE